jgi:multiple sugar transport system permease protein
MRNNLAGLLFVSPAFIAILVFFFGPAIAALLLSFTDFDIYALADLKNLRFVGFDNYINLLQTPLFWKALSNTLFFVFIGGPVSMAASLGAAILLNATGVWFKSFVRTIFFAPVVTTLVASALIFKYLLHTKYGFLNYGLSFFGISPIDWLGDPKWAMPAIIIFAVWKNFGYNMVIFIAALQNVSQDLNEAARVDGANIWQRFLNVTLPALGPSILMVSIMTMTGFFQLFAEPYVMTQGGPAEQTVTVLYMMYEQGFKWWNLGNASAVAFILFVFMLLMTMIQMRVAKWQGVS